MKKRLLSFLLIFTLIIGACPITAFAASTTTYITIKDDVPIWSSYYDSSTKVKTISDKGTLLYVTGYKYNKYLNKWYQMSDGNWVYSKNVEKHETHNYTGGICDDCGHEWICCIESMSNTTYQVTNTSGATIWSRPYSNNSDKKGTASYGTTLTIVAKTTNEDGNVWYKTSSGTWVYSGNIAKHSSHTYTGQGVCSVCGYTYNCITTMLNSTKYEVTNKSGAGLYSNAYESSTKKSTAAYGDVLTIVASTVNAYGNIWFKTSSGTWIYNGNVSKYEVHTCSFDHYGTASYTYSYYNDTYHTTTTKRDKICSCGAVISNVASTATEKHDYLGGICEDCGYEWICCLENVSNMLYKVSNTSGATLWSRPYSNNSENKGTASYGTMLTIVSKTINQAGNTWYKTSSGTWVYSGNVIASGTAQTCTTHSYTSASGDICTVCGATYEPTYTKVNDTYYCTYSSVSMRYAPYADSGNIVDTVEFGESLYITYSFKNSLGNTWYKTDKGYYVYSEYFTNESNYTLNESTSNETIGYVDITTPTVFSTVKKNVDVYTDYETISYSDFSHALSEEGTLVTIINSEIDWKNNKEEYGETINGTYINMSDLKESSIQPPVTGLYIVTEDNTPLRKEASSSATIKSTLSKGEQIKIVDTFYNDKGNAWGETSDGYIVYMGNLKYTYDTLVIKVNGEVLELSANAFTTNGSTMIPLRDVAESLGAFVDWDEDSFCAIIQRGLETAVIEIGSDKMYASEIIDLNTGAVLINGLTYVPIRAVSEIFGADVDWVADTNTVTIEYDEPTEDEVLEEFITDEFGHFAVYTTQFINENATLGNAVLYSLSNIGSAASSVLYQAAKNASGISYIQKMLGDDSAYAYDDFGNDLLESNLSEIIDQIMLVDSGYYSSETYDDCSEIASDYLDALKKGNKYVIDDDKWKDFLSSASFVLDMSDFTVDMLVYLMNDYSRHVEYLDLIEEMYDPESKGQQSVFDDLREEYTNTYLTIATKAFEEIRDKGIELVIENSSSVLKASIVFIEATTEIIGVKKSSTNIVNAAVGVSLAGGLITNYGYLYSNEKNSSSLPSLTTSQSEWDEIVVNFTAAKGATMYIYDKMYNATSDVAMKTYLKVQSNLLNLIQINTNISTARKTPYYIDEFTSLVDG